MNKKAIIWTLVVLLVLWLAICFYSIVRAENSTKIDYSWASRITEEREVNKTIISEKIIDRNKLNEEIEKLEKRNEDISCKLVSWIKEATCEEGLK